MRDLNTTIDQLLAVIPKTEKDLITYLKARKRLLLFMAPEGSSPFWFLISSAFMEFLPTDVKKMNDWQKRVHYIWTTPQDKRKPEGFR